MSRAGFVLAGGESSRMGRNKALLPAGSRTLIEQIAEAVFTAAGSAVVVGDPSIYGHLRFPVIPDRKPGEGPLSGIDAALAHTRAEWNLIVACDMPWVDSELMTGLLRRAGELSLEIDCLMPGGAPLCAVYRKRCGVVAEAALLAGTRRVYDWLDLLQVRAIIPKQPAIFQSVNTPGEWERFLSARP